MRASRFFLCCTLLSVSAVILLRALFNLSMCRGNKLCFAPLVNLEKEEEKARTALNNERDAINNCLKNAKREKWHITKGADRLYARVFFREGSHKWAVVVHGYGGEGGLMLYAVKRFYEKGYNVLLPDLRAHGKSTGKYIGWGWRDKEDIENWCECIKNRDKSAKIVLYGVSMGGAAVLMSAGDNKIKGLRCVVSDCAYTSLKDIMYYRIRRMLHLPPCLVMFLLKPMCKSCAGIRVDKVSVCEHVKKCRVPVMLCHGDRDRFVPTDNVLELYAVAKVPKSLMLVHGAGHGVSAFMGGEKYWDRVFDFTERFIEKN